MKNELDARVGHELERFHLHAKEVVRATERNERLKAEANAVQHCISEHQGEIWRWNEKAAGEVVALSTALNDSKVSD